ncbi:MAG: hypothetical protein R2839_09220 [Thermomicrobiales bacterium]
MARSISTPSALETYATVFSLVESPHKRGLFWAGTDDGLIHLSRDNAKTWKNITPPDLPEWTMISSIELSPFDDKTAYVAGTRYKLDDYDPYLYVTRDLGKSWNRIDADMPRGDFTRVIRCDPQVPGLLCGGPKPRFCVDGRWRHLAATWSQPAGHPGS